MRQPLLARQGICGVLAILMLGLGVSCASSDTVIPFRMFKARQLSDRVISELRTDYPVYIMHSPIKNRMTRLLDAVVQRTDAYIVAEVVSSPDEREVALPLEEGSAEAELFEKIHSQGGAYPTAVYVEATIRILDIFFQNGVCADLEVGQEITISRSMDYANALPYEEGMQFVSSLHGSTIDTVLWDYACPDVGFYYLVDGDYVLSSYPEMDPYTYDGMSLSRFRREILNIRDQ